ncbi:MAG: carbohydrate ABC transporter permease [Oscillospiraceae bacterium]|nr:carbohydrate ABC transporter permease [Oscillospiraceae bacterium]
MLQTKGEKAFQLIAHLVMILETICVILPFVLLIMSSFTDENELVAYGYSFWPNKFSIEAYKYLIKKGGSIFRAYGLTIAATVVGTTIHLMMGSMLAFSLALKNLPGKKFFSFYVFFTMLFSGGLVPTYLTYTNVFHIKNTFFALVVPYLMLSAIHVLLMRSFFSSSIPDAIYEAAEIDGAGLFTTYTKIVLPLGKPILVTIGLFAGLDYWNDWLNGLYFMSDQKMYGIQTLLYRILEDIRTLASSAMGSAAATSIKIPSVSIRMAIAFVAIIPIIIIYPFLQKYFQEGIALGAVKG